MTKKFLTLTCVSMASLLILSACGRDDNQTWEAIEYEGAPYTEERTAGKGIKYVLAALAPKKGPVLKLIMEATKEIAPEMSMPVKPVIVSRPPEPEIKSATPIFNKRMGKAK